ncbi:hypothetical protein AB4Z45_27780 [Paenibacillus sp. MCAF9]|uniref:hypothetical protein n=1 Tax=Paenibacillus sp. MCAF9 TaxID=3233046 RepID=UPI003F944E57
MDLFLLLINEAISFLTNTENIELITSYLELFVVARAVKKPKEKTPDNKSRVDSKNEDNPA